MKTNDIQKKYIYFLKKSKNNKVKIIGINFLYLKKSIENMTVIEIVMKKVKITKN